MFTIRPKSEILEALKNAAENNMATPWGMSVLDHRDINRLLKYVSFEEAKEIFGDGITANNADEWGDRRNWDTETVTSHIKNSLEFAFDKALNQRGISASLMHNVMVMWMWVIGDDGLVEDAYYDNYGLPFFYQVRDKYFPGMKVL